MAFSTSTDNNDGKLFARKNSKSKSKTSEKKTPDHSANAVTKSGSSQLRPLHWVTMATTNTQTDNPQHKYSELSEWLIDSGCSNHMTPFEDDLISDVTKSKALVEVANGNIVKAPKKGTVKIKIVDALDNSSYEILLEDILFVPGLSR